jgi:hypothetical protein
VELTRARAFGFGATVLFGLAATACAGPAPTALHQGVCKDADTSAYYDACLVLPVDPARCDPFKNTHATCAACLASDETARTYGPVVWHAGAEAFTLNVAGCIADEQSDVGPRGCGAAYQALVECKEQSCRACLERDGATYNAFANCEDEAGVTVCQALNAAKNTACRISHALDAPTNACSGSGEDGTREVFAKLGRAFCGSPSGG